MLFQSVVPEFECVSGNAACAVVNGQLAFACFHSLVLEKLELSSDKQSNALWAGPVSALPWVPLSAYAADGKPAAWSKGYAAQ